MAKITWTFVDEYGTNLNRYIATDINSGVTYDFDLIRNADISQVGTSLNSTNLNQLISSINSLYDETSSINASINTINDNITKNNTDITDIYGLISSTNSNFSNYVPITRTINNKGLSSDITLDKSDIGLGNVDNTSDVNKPISSATQTALDKKANDSDVVKLTGEQTISGSKTFTGVQKFTGESRFSNSEYCPDDSITDIANGIGKSSLFARSMTMHTITGQIIAPNTSSTNDTYGYNVEKDTVKIQYISSYTESKIIGYDMAVFTPNHINFDCDEEININLHGDTIANFNIYGLDINGNINTSTINGGTPIVTSNDPMISDSNVVLNDSSLVYSGSDKSTTIKLTNELSTFKLIKFNSSSINVDFSISDNTLGSSSITITITNVKQVGDYYIDFYVYDIFGTKVTKRLYVSKI